MYRGAEVIVDRQCGYKGGQIYCRTVPDWVEVQPGNEELNNIEEVIEVFISPVDMEHMAVTVSDPSFSAGGSVENFNQNSYTLVKDRPSKCRPAQ